jgi:hypothetical protein
MTWMAPDVGLVDGRGRAFCLPCADKLDHVGEFVSGDQHFSADDKCDACGCQFEHVRTRDYVQVAPGYETRRPILPTVRS